MCESELSGCGKNLLECLINKTLSCFKVRDDIEIREAGDTVVVTCAVVLILIAPDPCHKELSVAPPRVNVLLLSLAGPEAVVLFDTLTSCIRVRYE